MSHIVTLHCSCSSTKVRSERRFDKGITIADLKGKLEMILGVSAATSELSLKDHTGALICNMDNNEAMLGAYPVEDFLELYALDKNPHKAISEFEDLSLVDKIEMSQDDYDQRTDSVKAYKMRNKMGRFNPEFAKEQAAAAESKDTEGEEKAATIKKGDRCECAKGGKKRGEVMYVGKPEFAPGWWIGIKYDEPLGKNDGTAKGKRYFECPQGFGHFVRPCDVEVGDYPEEELSFSSSEDEM